MAFDPVQSARTDGEAAGGDRLGLLVALAQESLRAVWVSVVTGDRPAMEAGTKPDGDDVFVATSRAGEDSGLELQAALVDRQWTDRDSVLLGQFARMAALLAGTPPAGRPDEVPARDPGADHTPDPRFDADHEIRSGLQEIIGFTEFLKRETRPEVVASHASTIQSAAETLLQQFRRGTLEPVAEPPQGDDAAAVESAHILLADDLDLNRKLICDMLSLEGHVVDSVADGASAVKAACERSYDLILMDMIMPGMDGVAATRAIRALPSPACDVPIVALTAHSLPEQLDSCIEAGMDATLTKPMSMDALTGAVATWTRRRRKAA